MPETWPATDALQAEHGIAGLVLGQQFRQFKLREDRLFFDMPMIAGIARASRGVIVHSLYGAVKVRARCPSVPVTVVPHEYSPPPADEIEAPDDLRYELGVADTELLFMSLGFVTKAKRIDLAIRRLRRSAIAYRRSSMWWQANCGRRKLISTASQQRLVCVTG